MTCRPHTILTAHLRMHRAFGSRAALCAVAFCLTFCTATERLPAQDSVQRLRIIHSNDIQSRLLGYGPNNEYTPRSTGDDLTIGGLARIATVIREKRAAAPERTLLVDGGDFLMGTLFHTIARSESAELRLMGALGYDAATLGNHEFDFGPNALADLIRRAVEAGPAPALLLSNASYPAADARVERFARLYADSLVRPFTIIERGGIRVGLFGLVGVDAAEVAPMSKPVTFQPPVEAARSAARALRAQGADIVIALSHGGVWKPPGKTEWQGDDIDIALSVPEVSVVVGGHSHTMLPEPLLRNGTPIVQAGGEGAWVGILDLAIRDRQVSVEAYEMVRIDDAIPGDPAIEDSIAAFIEKIDAQILAPHQVQFAQPLLRTDFDLVERQSDCNLGNLVADALLWGARRAVAGTKDTVSFAVEANGQIRDNIVKGQNGVQQVSDLFRVVGLGVGQREDSPGHPMILIYMTAAELKRALEVLTTVAPLKGPSYFLQVAGLRVTYNANRILFDRVVEVEREQSPGVFVPLDLSESNPRLYGVALNYYVGSLIGAVGRFTNGLVVVTPKDRDGVPYTDLKRSILNADPTPGAFRELKIWSVFLAYLQAVAEPGDGGLPIMPDRYRQAQGRIIAIKSWSPTLLFKNATWIMWTAAAAPLVLLGGLTGGIILWRRKRAKVSRIDA